MSKLHFGPSPAARRARRLAERFRALGEPTRIKLLDRLREGEATVLELTRMMQTLRDFQAAQQVVDSQHEMSLDAINKIAKV